MNLHKATRRAANRHGVPAWLLEAQIQQESGFNPNATSPAGAHGIAQFIDSTAKAYGVNNRDSDPRDDLEGAARYMADNLKRTHGDIRAALSLYNSGRADGYKRFDETRNYVQRIMGAKGGRSTTASVPGGAEQGITLERGTTSVDMPDPELQRKQFFAQWFAQHNPNSPLVKLGAVDPNMSTTKTVKLPTVTGFRDEKAGKPGPIKGATLRPGGGYAGTAHLITGLNDLAGQHQLTVTSGKRATQMTTSGNVSDHFEGNKTAYAEDWSGAVPNMDRYAKALQKRLGFRDWKGVQTVTKQIGDHVYRFQMLYRTNVGGDHFNHVHLGAKRVT